MMKKQDENRRVRMTKRLMKDALLELLEEKELVKISVTAICELADVHRSTFYQYYADPADLLREIEQDFLDMIPEPSQVHGQEDTQKLNDVTSEFFDFIKENERTFRVLFNGESGSNFPAKLVDFLSSRYFPVVYNQDELLAGFTRLFITNGIVGIMREWVYAGFPISSQKIAETMYTLSRKVIY